jgi:hypothetical protein
MPFVVSILRCRAPWLLKAHLDVLVSRAWGVSSTHDGSSRYSWMKAQLQSRARETMCEHGSLKTYERAKVFFPGSASGLNPFQAC